MANYIVKLNPREEIAVNNIVEVSLEAGVYFLKSSVISGGSRVTEFSIKAENVYYIQKVED